MGQKKITYPAAYTAGVTPKLPYSDSSWSADRSEQYGAMDAYYAEYRRDSLTRNSINALAYFSTTKGFDAVIDLINPGTLDEEQVSKELESFSEFQDYIDKKNQDVGLDNILNIGITKNKIYGWTGFEFVKDKSGEVVQLLPRETERSNKGWGMGLIPLQNRVTGELEGFSYAGSKDKVFEANEILWFTNNGLEYDFSGISDIEPIFDQLGTRRYIMNEAFKETSKAMWAPYQILTLDTGRADEGEAKQMLNEIASQLKPGKALVVNQDIKAKVIDQKPAVDKLVAVLDAVDMDIIGNFRVPRFLLGREKQFNRATAFAEGALFLQGPIADIQKYVAREVERQWYYMLTVQYFKKRGVKEQDIKVKVKHQWNPITMNDWVEQAQTWVQLFTSGIANRDMALEGIGFDAAQINKEEDENPEKRAEATTLTYDVEDNAGNQYKIKKTASKPNQIRKKKK